MLRFCEEMVALLLKHFKSVKKIREASLEQLAEVVGVSKAGIIRDGLAG
jgi:excinuclease ABC subunit C